MPHPPVVVQHPQPRRFTSASLLRCRRMPARGQAGLALLVLAGALALHGIGAASAAAHTNLSPDRYYAGPNVRVYDASGGRWSSELRGVVRGLNRRGLPVRLLRVRSAKGADIVIRTSSRLSCAPGRVAGRGGYGSLELAAVCPAGIRPFVLAHELGHALGLGHEDDLCATMNSVFLTDRNGNGYGKRCAPGSHDWRREPYLRDDRAGLRARYANHPPQALLSATSAIDGIDPGDPVRFRDDSSDADGNALQRRVDWGDGTSDRTVFQFGWLWNDWIPEHRYEAAGSFTVTLTVTDSYGVRRRASKTVTVLAPPPDPGDPPL